MTVDRQCGSSQQAVHFAAAGLIAGHYDVVVAGGVESMSRVPLGSWVQGADPVGAEFLARYEGAYAAAPLFIMGQRSGFAWKDVPQFNYIDTLVYEKLRQVKVLPSDVCTDADFIRRMKADGVPLEVEGLVRKRIGVRE